MVTRKSKSNDSEPEMKLTRASKIFEERFEKLRLAFRQAEGDEIDDVFAAIVSHLTSSEEECKQFMLRCNYTQMRTLLLVLDDVASAFANVGFLQTIKQLQARFPQYDLSGSMDVVAYMIAELAHVEFSKKDRRVSREKILKELYAKAAAGDPEAQFRLALRCYFGSDGRADYDVARKWAQKAIDQGYAPAAIFRDLPRD
ncbi:MAG: SEL1-like repeat protein [Thermoguttaceae bacterium]|nr:SEL1-like repeat protein [Thermoguttaceae bacterium]